MPKKVIGLTPATAARLSDKLGEELPPVVPARGHAPVRAVGTVVANSSGVLGDTGYVVPAYWFADSAEWVTAGGVQCNVRNLGGSLMPSGYYLAVRSGTDGTGAPVWVVLGDADQTGAGAYRGGLVSTMAQTFKGNKTARDVWTWQAEGPAPVPGTTPASVTVEAQTWEDATVTAAAGSAWWAALVGLHGDNGRGVVRFPSGVNGGGEIGQGVGFAGPTVIYCSSDYMLIPGFHLPTATSPYRRFGVIRLEGGVRTEMWGQDADETVSTPTGTRILKFRGGLYVGSTTPPPPPPPPPPPATYNCVSGSCVDPGDGSGFYTSLTDCQNNCTSPPPPPPPPLGWSCVPFGPSFICQQDGGPHPDEATCMASCPGSGGG